MAEIVLGACRPMPLASYLKSLALLRLVAEQADSKVKGRWCGDTFVLDTILTEGALLDYFTDRYRPTPIVAPWNGGSGFSPGDARDGMDALLAVKDDRFARYQQVITSVCSWPEMSAKLKTVRDVTVMLEEAARNSRSGKRQKLERIVTSIDELHRAARKALGDQPTLDMNLDELEAQSRGPKGPQKQAASNWWKVVSKARTECVKMHREAVKRALLAACRSRLPDECLAWLDAAVVIRNDLTRVCNPLLGTGGNEGHLELSKNFMQRLAGLLITGQRESATELLRSTLFGDPCPGLISARIGQLDPGRAGGFNQGAEIETKDFKINPWDFVLMLEGALALSSAVARWGNAEGRSLAAIPFTVEFSGVGFSSNLDDNDGQTDEKANIKEMWLPTWNRPAGWAEISHLLREGRSTVGRRAARNGLDFMRAVGSLGVDRGVEGFVRYAFIKRRGSGKKAAYIALPAGRLPARFKPDLRLLDDLDPILFRVDGFLRGFPNIPATFASARRNIDRAVYDCCENPDAVCFSSLLRALGRMERMIAQRDRSKKPSLSRPLMGLRPAWIVQCDGDGPEVRLAAALASIHATGKVGGIRSNMAGVDAAASWKWASGTGQQHWVGNTLVERLGGVLSHRLMDAERLSTPTVPVQGSVLVLAHDVVPFLYGETDDELLEELLWAFTLVNWRKDGVSVLAERWRFPLTQRPLPRNWAIMKLLHTPGRIRGASVRMEPRIAVLLAAGRPEEAAEVACRRLGTSGLRPVTVRYEEWADPGRLLAALLIPARPGRLESLVLQEQEPKS